MTNIYDTWRRTMPISGVIGCSSSYAPLLELGFHPQQIMEILGKDSNVLEARLTKERLDIYYRSGRFETYPVACMNELGKMTLVLDNGVVRELDIRSDYEKALDELNEQFPGIDVSGLEGLSKDLPKHKKRWNAKRLFRAFLKGEEL